MPRALTPNAWITFASGTGLTGFNADNIAVPEGYALQVVEQNPTGLGIAADGVPFDIQISAVPEPSRALLPIALCGLTFCQRRGRRVGSLK